MAAIDLQLDHRGLTWLVFDVPKTKVNIFTPSLMDELEQNLDHLLREKPRGVILTSGKPGTFIAGADIKELQAIEDAAHARELSRHGHRVFGKLRQLQVPTVAAIDGACLGGGLELALACRYRVATDEKHTMLGLPETQLGIIPGWGGTQLLPRLIGLRAALDLILAGKRLDGRRALKRGLLDALVPAVALRDTAASLAMDQPRHKRRWPGWENRWPMRGIICQAARKQTTKRSGGHYPALPLAIDVIEDGLKTGSLESALELEATALSDLVPGAVSKNLVRLFFLREKQAKLRLTSAGADDIGPAAGSPTKIAVMGAGVMGSGIAQWCSARGIRVRLKDIKPEFVAAGMKRIADLYASGVKHHKLTRREAASGLARVSPTTTLSGIGQCGIVIEAVVEDLAIKQRLFEELGPVLDNDCVIASNTSAIPIDDLAAASGRPERFVGIHFFNPVHRMPLVEIVRGQATSEETLYRALEFVKQLKKIPVIVKGTPGFLVNRLLMPYLNEAGKLVDEGVSVQAIDAAMTGFGWPMGPLRLVDEIGIDVAYEVACELAAAFGERMAVCGVLQKLHEEGLKGRKGGRGFYVYGKNGRTTTTPKPNRSFRRGRTAMAASAIEQRLMKVMVEEAQLCLAEQVVASEDDVDVAMIFGTGFPPFRGGLMVYARASGLWSRDGHPELRLPESSGKGRGATG